MAQKRITDLDAVSALSGDELIEVSQLSETVFITATTISAAATDNSFNDSANGFVTAGFQIGDRVNVVGFTGNVANNLFVGILTTVAAGKIELAGTDGDVIVDDAAGESVTITKWTSRRASAQEIAALAGAGPSVVQTEAADYTVDPDDVDHYIRLTNASTKDITVDPEATTALPDNGEWHFRNIGAGDATFVEGSGVTITPPNGGTLAVPQNGTVTLKRVAADEFDLLGQTVAV